jgi:hypothetical protein
MLTPVIIGVGLTAERHLTALHDGPLRDRDHRILARVRVPVRHEETGKPVDVDVNLRDHRAVHGGQVGGDQ